MIRCVPLCRFLCHGEYCVVSVHATWVLSGVLILLIYYMLLQTEKSFQRQPIVFSGYKKLLAKKGKLTRWTRNVGLGFKTPVTAIKV